MMKTQFRGRPFNSWGGGGVTGQQVFELFFVKKIPLSRRVGYVMGRWISGSVVQWISGSVDQ